MTALIVFLVVAALVVIALAAILLDDSVVRIPTGELGLLLVNGKPTGRALAPGRHLVPAFRRRLVEVYPSRELAYRAGDAAEGPLDDLERSGPIVDVLLGDRTAARVSYTVRFRLDPSDLRTVHERFGRDGIWSAVRDVSARALRTALNDPTVAADSTYGPARHALETTVGEAVGTALAEQALHLTAFALDSVDLGRAGDTIQGAVRARLELEREQAEGEMRLARARTDAEVAGLLTGLDADMALRYREADAWRDLVTELARGTRPIPVRPIRAADERGADTAASPAEPSAPLDDDGSDEA
jgi:regulator of protease activity HflC (stomatin/prohibitin superfamily)